MKKIEIFLLVAVCALSFVCYSQHKKIHDLEWDIASLESDVDTLEGKVKDLENEIEDMKPSIEELQEEMEEHFPRPQKTPEQKRQDYIKEINRFNAAREREEQRGIKNTDKRVDGYRQWLKFVKERYNIDIEIK